MKYSLYFLLLILSSCFAFCEDYSKWELNDDRSLDKKLDTVILDIPLDKKGLRIDYWKKAKELERKIGLERLELGFDSLQVRIWHAHSFTDKVQLVILKNQGYKWRGTLYSLKCRYSDNGDSLVMVEKEVRQVVPKNGWKKLMDRLYSLKVLVLPHYETIENYSLCNDGDGITVETATAKKYRIYNYPCPRNQSNIWQAENAQLILEIVNKEFQLPPIFKSSKHKNR